MAAAETRRVGHAQNTDGDDADVDDDECGVVVWNVAPAQPCRVGDPLERRGANLRAAAAAQTRRVGHAPRKPLW